MPRVPTITRRKIPTITFDHKQLEQWEENKAEAIAIGTMEVDDETSWLITYTDSFEDLTGEFEELKIQSADFSKSA